VKLAKVPRPCHKPLDIKWNVIAEVISSALLAFFPFFDVAIEASQESIIQS
jgi:hypothetical protein